MYHIHLSQDRNPIARALLVLGSCGWGGCLQHEFGLKLVAELLSANVVPAGGDVSGKVIAGEIMLPGWLLRIRTTARISDGSHPCALFTSSLSQGMGKLWADDPNENTFDTKLHFWPLKMAKNEERGVVFGLALQMTGREGEFRRIGSVPFFGVCSSDRFIVPQVGECMEYSSGTLHQPPMSFKPLIQGYQVHADNKPFI